MSERGTRKRLAGIVVGEKMDKTAMVLVSRLKKHRTYGKYYREQKKYMAHDPYNRCRPGDKVSIIESKPMSKNKRWRVIEIEGKAYGRPSADESSGGNMEAR
jgi:small subunit ribosomal protein S17